MFLIYFIILISIMQRQLNFPIAITKLVGLFKYQTDIQIT